MILKSSLIIFSANLIAHALNYAYHLISAKFLDPSQFSLLQSFVSLNYFLAVLTASFSLSIIYQYHQTPQAKLPSLVESLKRLSLKLTLGFWLITLASLPILKRLLHFQNPYLLIIFSIQLLFAFLPVLYTSLLQAGLKFKHFSIINILAPLFKLLTAVILFLLGLKIFSPLIALVIAGLVPALFSIIFVKNQLKLKPAKPLPLPRSFFTFGLSALITNLSLTSLYNTDILLTRFFVYHQSGLYSIASILTRIIFFLANTILVVAFPVFASQKSPKKLKKTFQQSLFLITGLSFLGLVFYNLFPKLIINIFQPAYRQTVNYLPGMALFFFFFTIFNLLIQFLLITNKRLATAISLSTAILQIILIFISHQNLFSIITNNLIAILIGLFIAFTASIKFIYAKN